MKLPNFENAVVSIEKLRDYCLNENHPKGKHKAKVFKSLLNFDNKDAELLKINIENAIAVFDAVESYTDKYGKRYYVDFELIQAVIRTSWIIKTNETFPRLTSCYIKI